MQGLDERALVLQAARRQQPGELLHVEARGCARGEAAGRRHRGVRARRGPGMYEAKGEFQLNVTSCCPPRPSARRSASWSG